MIQKNFSGIGDKVEHSEDSHVQKIWHNSDITKNWNPEVAEIFFARPRYVLHATFFICQTMGWDGTTERIEHNRIELKRLKYQLRNSVVAASWSFKWWPL